MTDEPEVAVTDWGSMFALATPVPELVVRGTVTYVALLLLMRVVGQREAGGLGLTDVLVVVLVADAASVGLVGDASTVTDGLVVVVTILFWSVAADAAAYRWPKVAAVVKARPRPVIVDGVVNRRALRREFMSFDELLSQLRLNGVEHPSQVRRAYLEPDGHISVLRAEPGGGAGPPSDRGG